MILRGDIMGNIDNIYIDCEQRIIYLSDIIDNITIGKITFFLLEIIKNDDRKEKKKSDFQENQFNYISILAVEIFVICGL